MFRDKPLDFAPGERYAYSNSNYNLLAHIIEKTSGLDYGEFLKKEIFSPLGLTHTGHDGDPRRLIPGRASGYAPLGQTEIENAPYLDWSIKTGNGSLYSTVGDLFKWHRALTGGDSAVLRARWTPVLGLGLVHARWANDIP